MSADRAEAAGNGEGRYPSLAETLVVARFSARQIYRSQLPRMAAALAYRTIFAIVPVLVIGLAILGAFASKERVEAAVGAVLEYTGISEIELGTDDLAVTIGPSPDTPGASAARLDLWIEDIVRRVESAPLITIGLTGLAALVYAAVSFLIEIERAFNHVYRAPAGRSWLRRLTQYWTLLTLGVLLLFATFYVGDQVAGWLAGLGGAASEFTGLIDFGVSAVISALVLLLMYATVPNARVRLRPALVGAAVAALMWELAKLGLEAYVLSLARGYTKVYGAIGLVPIFLLWVYLTWLIVLFGLQVTYLLQTFRDAASAGFDEEVGLIDPASALAVASRVAARFDNGRSATLAELSEELRLPEDVVERLIEGLIGAGVTHRVARDGGEAFAMAKPPHRVEAAEVLNVGLALASGPVSDPHVAAARRAQVAALRGVMLAAAPDGGDSRAPEPTLGGMTGGESTATA